MQFLSMNIFIIRSTTNIELIEMQFIYLFFFYS